MSSPPEIQNMSKPRRVSSDKSRTEGVEGVFILLREGGIVPLKVEINAGNVYRYYFFWVAIFIKKYFAVTQPYVLQSISYFFNKYYVRYPSTLPFVRSVYTFSHFLAQFSSIITGIIVFLTKK